MQDFDYQPYGETKSTGAVPGTPQYSTTTWNGGDALAEIGLVQRRRTRLRSGHRPLPRPRSALRAAHGVDDEPVRVRAQRSGGTFPIPPEMTPPRVATRPSRTRIRPGSTSDTPGRSVSGTRPQPERPVRTFNGDEMINGHTRSWWERPWEEKSDYNPYGIREYIGEQILNMMPPTLLDSAQRDHGPTTMEMQQACNRGMGVLCLDARDRRIGARVERANLYITYWANTFAQGVNFIQQVLAMVGAASLAANQINAQPLRSVGGCTGTCGGEPTCFTAGTPVATSSGPAPIETIHAGDRLRSLDEASCAQSIDRSSCRAIDVEMNAPYGYADTLRATFLRTEDEVAAGGVVVGGEMPLVIDELGLDGTARVTHIGACAIEEAPGCVVTGTISHLNHSVLRLHFAESDETLEPTTLHPLWSLDRGGWVHAGDLVVGERLRTQYGSVTIASIEPLPGAHRVYNFEIAGAHTYLVSDLAIYSHNGCAGRLPQDQKANPQAPAAKPTAGRTVGRSAAQNVEVQSDAARMKAQGYTDIRD